MRPASRHGSILPLTGTLLLAVVLASLAAATDEGWVIERFAIQLEIHDDGSITAHDALDVDFQGLERHGIYRDVAYRQEFDEARDREYGIDLHGVTDAAGRSHEVAELDEGPLRRFRIGDPDRTISGKQTYRIRYRITDALNGFADHDELYWNASGTWPVPIESATIEVRAPGDAIERVECFQGLSGSTDRCAGRYTGGTAAFGATRPLAAGEQLTIVVGLRKGVVPAPQPRLVNRPRTAFRWFDRTPGLIAGLAAGLVLAVGGVGALWWKQGRDRRYVSLHYLSNTQAEETVPLFGSDPIVVEFEPPDDIRPGQMGLLLDERADTLDVTATIVDLAVRGYLSITEIPATGWFSKTDWKLTSLKSGTDLLEYERIVFNGLFKSATSRKLSDLKNTFYVELAKAKSALYEDAVSRKWFPRRPNATRTAARWAAFLTTAAGIVLIVWLGRRWGAGLLGLPIVAGGLLLAVTSGLMPRRTAAGREALRRTLGFMRYIKTAETHQQAFAERANLFTRYLPYAIAFKAVEKWASAFRDIDMRAATAGWYAGGSSFEANTFSSNLASFSRSVSSSLASTPGGSGGSGFSGGSSGGGGGGGGGGSW